MRAEKKIFAIQLKKRKTYVYSDFPPKNFRSKRTCEYKSVGVLRERGVYNKLQTICCFEFI